MSQDSHEHHITPFPIYIKVFSALIVLTVITVVASLFDFGAMNTVIAMLIATVKAFVVVYWFMHMGHEGWLNRSVFIMAFFFLVVFFVLTAMDIFTRTQFDNVLPPGV